MDNNSGLFMFSDRTYEFIKRLVQVILPAFSAAYFGLAAIWGLPAAEQVVGTVAVLTTFLGVSLGISTKTYEARGADFDGDAIVSTDLEGKKTYSLAVRSTTIDNLEEKDSLRFKIVSVDDQEPLE